MKQIFVYIKILLLCQLASVIANAQSDSLKSIVKKFNTYKTKNLQEKLFLHIDRQTYLVGETIWFKIYCIDASTHKPLDISKVAYVELVGKNNKVALQTKVNMENGLRNGSVFLTPEFNSGNYTLRAYTQWMKNAEPDYFFRQPIAIINTFKNLGLEIKKDTAIYVVQFFPEGGNLVQGIQSKLAFKAMKNGKGIDCNGFILNQKNDTVVKFKPSNFGIGQFQFTVNANTEYKAYIKDGKKTVPVKLPVIYKDGYVMQLEDVDSITLNISISSTKPNGEAINLIAHTRQIVKIASNSTLKDGKCFFTINKKQLEEGISQFTIFNGSNKPVCERLYFKALAQNLTIEAKSSKTQYSPREKIDFDISVVNALSKPEKANLSLSVYLLDSLQSYPTTNISNYLFLSSDLKGTIESQEFYLNNNKETSQAIDNLMLTHGWRRFNWESILSGNVIYPAYFPELRGHIIEAKIRDSISQNLAENVETYLSAPGKILKLYNAKSDKQGKVLFETQELYGQKELIFQTLSPSGRKFKLELLSPFSDKFVQMPAQSFDLDEVLSKSILSKSIDVQSQNIFNNRNMHLNKMQVDSFPFYSKGDENYRLDDYTRFKTMEDVMKEYVSGVMVRKRNGKFLFMNLDNRNRDIFSESPLVLLDGVPVFDTDSIMKMDPLKIKKLQVVTQKYFLGPIIYSGIVSYTTYEGDMAGFFIDNKWMVFDYEGLQMNTVTLLRLRYESAEC